MALAYGFLGIHGLISGIVLFNFNKSGLLNRFSRLFYNNRSDAFSDEKDKQYDIARKCSYIFMVFALFGPTFLTVENYINYSSYNDPNKNLTNLYR